jgi:hypothetical protein
MIVCGRKCVLKPRRSPHAARARRTPHAARKATGAHAGLRGGRSVRRARGPVAGRIMLFMAVARARDSCNLPRLTRSLPRVMANRNPLAAFRPDSEGLFSRGFH